MSRRTVFLLFSACLLTVASSCRRIADPDPLVGTFIATTFVITYSGQEPTSVLAAGGILGVNVANNYVTKGTMIIPPVVSGGAVADLSGMATRTEDRVLLTQSNPTFLTSLVFTLGGDSLTARNQTVNGVTYDVVLGRQ